MQVTKNDLSFNSTKLDYMAMLQTAQIAFAHTRNEVERLVGKTHDLNPHADHSLTCGRILDVAEQLVVAAETMHTLEGGLEREELEVINKEGPHNG